MADHQIGYYQALRELDERFTKEREALEESLARLERARGGQSQPDDTEGVSRTQRDQADDDEVRRRGRSDEPDLSPEDAMAEPSYSRSHSDPSALERSGSLAEQDQNNVFGEPDAKLIGTHAASIRDEELDELMNDIERSRLGLYNASSIPERIVDDPDFSQDQLERLEKLAEDSIKLRLTEHGSHLAMGMRELCEDNEYFQRREFARSFAEGQPLDYEKWNAYLDYVEESSLAMKEPTRYLERAAAREEASEREAGKGQERETEGPAREKTDREVAREGLQAGREQSASLGAQWEAEMSDYARAMGNDVEREGPGLSIGGR